VTTWAKTFAEQYHLGTTRLLTQYLLQHDMQRQPGSASIIGYDKDGTVNPFPPRTSDIQGRNVKVSDPSYFVSVFTKVGAEREDYTRRHIQTVGGRVLKVRCSTRAATGGTDFQPLGHQTVPPTLPTVRPLLGHWIFPHARVEPACRDLVIIRPPNCWGWPGSGPRSGPRVIEASLVSKDAGDCYLCFAFCST